MKTGFHTVPLWLLAGISLAGFGYSPGSRALSGGAIGAGTGAATNPHNLNLGRPLVGN
jgi:osmotically inducible lipoprotein OsmB